MGKTELFEYEISQLSFSAIKGRNEYPDTVDCDLNLFGSYESEFGSCDVRWESTNEDVIDKNGRVSCTDNDEKVTLTGFFTVQEDEALRAKRVFELNVKADTDDELAVAEAAKALKIGYAAGLLHDIELPKYGRRGTKIEWESSDDTVITAQGKVTRLPQRNRCALLTATITRKNASAEKFFPLTAKAIYPVTADEARIVSGILKSVTLTLCEENFDGETIIRSGGREVRAEGLLYGVPTAIKCELPCDGSFTVTAGDIEIPAKFPVKSNARIFIVGDSTACDYSDNDYPRKGWGQMLANYFDAEVVENLAMSGRSSVSFKRETNYDKLKTDLLYGDYLIIQFGHNDQKQDGSGRYSNPNTDRFTAGSYKKSLCEYIDIAFEREAHPIIATSISRRSLSDEGLEQYVRAARELANELGLPLLDAYAKTNSWINSVGEQKAKDMFNILLPHDPRFEGKAEYETSNFRGRGSSDNTHLNVYGADLIAQWMCEEMKREELPIAKRINSHRAVYPLPVGTGEKE